MPKFTASFNDAEYALIHTASMRGGLDASFTRSQVGEVTFTSIRDPIKFCWQLDHIVDFGVTTAFDVFNVMK